MTSDKQFVPGRWNQRKRDIGISIWIAFLAACVGTMIIFAALDPEALNQAWVLPFEMGRKLAYSLGFLFLFCVSFLASGLTTFMIRTGPRRGHRLGEGRRPAPEMKDIHDDEDLDLDIDPGDWR
jgi:hypothetical protein